MVMRTRQSVDAQDPRTAHIKLTIDHQCYQWNVLIYFIFFIHRIKDEFLYHSIKHGYAILFILYLLGVNKRVIFQLHVVILYFVKQKNRRINKWRFFIKASNIHDQISLNLLNSFYFYNLGNTFCSEMFKNEVINRDIH